MGWWSNLINQHTLMQNDVGGGRSEEQEAFAEGESGVSRELKQGKGKRSYRWTVPEKDLHPTDPAGRKMCLSQH